MKDGSTLLKTTVSYYFQVLEIVEKPEFIMRGNKGTLKATKNMGKERVY